MYREIELRLISTNCSIEPSKMELYIYMLNITSSVEDEYKDFIKAKPTSI